MVEVITIDGPTSSGKNSVGFLLAQKLGYQYIDTGMIYRAGSLYIIKHGVSLDNTEAVIEAFKDLNIEFKNGNSERRLYLDGEDVTDVLHSREVTKVVPVVAAIAKVREVMKSLQKEIGFRENTVMSGRDIGSEIFPDAKHKFYLTATPEIRAKRRYDQLVKKDPNIKYEDVLKDMMERDEKDTTREVSPLRIPEGAVVIDTSDLTIEQTVDKMIGYINQNV